MRKYDISEVYQTLKWALSCLPGVKPRFAKELIEYWQWLFIMKNNEVQYVTEVQDIQENENGDLFLTLENNVVISDSDIKELCLGYDKTLKLSPKGAKTLIRLYEAKILPMSVKKTKPVDHKLIEYTGQEDELRLKFEEMVNTKTTEHEKWRSLVENPDLIQASDYSYKLLNEVFIHRFGLTGDAEMKIGPYQVTKTVAKYQSNSGKSYDWEVEFTYTDNDGNEKQIRKPSAYAGNRRNDADRNYGLPE